MREELELKGVNSNVLKIIEDGDMSIYKVLRETDCPNQLSNADVWQGRERCGPPSSEMGIGTGLRIHSVTNK